MKKLDWIGASAVALMIATPAFAQQAKPAEAEAADDSDAIIVTAQRQAQSLQEVPIAVSAFTAEALEKQQIDNASDLQLTLPNVVFSKGNFTGSSFTIRGIGDLCVGVSCDSATAIHINGTPLLGTRLFETEYFDLERVEVLRGPQGTLFGRNATSGVVNFVSAKPDLSGFKGAAEAEYGNFNSVKVKGMLNIPVSDTFGVRVAGFYLNRDGYTKNVYNNSKIDGRDMYAIRGSARWEPTEDTTIDLMAYYFKEKDNRARIQKQLCHRDPSGVLGCLPDKLAFETLNANSTFVGVLSSREFLAVNGIPSALGLGSLYGPDAYTGFVSPANVRQVNTDFNPEYATSEQQYQARLEQKFGDVKLQLTGLYHKANVESRQDYNQSVQNRAGYATGLATLAAFASPTGPLGAAGAAYLGPLAAAITPGGPTGALCTSDTETTGTGAFGGHKICSSTPLDFDRSNSYTHDYSIEGIFSSDFDGPLNFLVGGIYADLKLTENSYYVNSFGIDYVTGILGSFTSLGAGRPASYLGTPFFRNNTPFFSVKSLGLFGEVYYDVSDKFKITGGIRYNKDRKRISARSTLANFLTPYTSTNAFASPYAAGFDADPGSLTACPTTNVATGSQNSNVAGALGSVPGCEAFQNRRTSGSEITGRVVLDYKITDDNLLYASYSRGYKSGGINPPLQPIFSVPESFAPEFVNAFEIGSKNQFADGKITLNLTAFYYQYKALQLSRIVARTSVNDNVDANIYGLELESILKPTRELAINLGASYLHTKVSQDKFLSNPRDPSGGRSDAVIIKDITNGSNCAVVPTTSGNAAGTNQLVGAINGGLGLQAPAAFLAGSGLGATGAFGICNVVAGSIANPSAGLRNLFNTPTGALPFTMLAAGVAVNIKGNRLPQAPTTKFNAGIQYTAELSSGMAIVPRFDFIYTGNSYGNIFNGAINKVKSYTQMNAQIQLNGKEDKWFVRGFVQNIANNNATTGLYVTDQSSGLFTNIFTLEPRRYGLAAGIKF